MLYINNSLHYIVNDDNIDSLDFGNIKNLSIDSNLSIENIDKLFTKLVKYNILEYLNCNRNLNITVIPQLTNLDSLSCDYTNISNIPILPNLRYLNCSGLKNLNSVPFIVSLNNVYCNSCHSLTNIPPLPKLIILDCNDCSNLTYIPILPNLERLYCRGLKKLVNIPILPNLIMLKCEYCDSLVSIPLLPKLTYLRCKFCKFISNISSLPELTTLICCFCSSLTYLPILPKLKNLDHKCARNINKYSIPLRFITITSLVIDDLDKYFSYNSENLTYLNEKLDSHKIPEKLVEKINEFLCHNLLVKSASKI